MNALFQFQSRLSPELKQTVKNLKTPFDVQEYLSHMPYNAEVRDRSPLNVMRDCQCHCLDGGFLAALLLWRLGYLPLVLDLRPDPGTDDDHVLALFQAEGRWGAVAKSNYINLGFREAVYQSPRELAMSYFEHYLNTTKEKTLRSFTRPMDLTKYPDTRWSHDEAAANLLYRHFYKRKEIPLITKSLAKRLSHVTERSFKAETLGTDMSQVFGIRED
jgi:hypothetical protein